MSPRLYCEVIPKCLDDDELLKKHNYHIKPVNNVEDFPSEGFQISLYYCEKCQSYLSALGMEKDSKKAILGHSFIEGGETLEESLGDIEIEKIS